MAIPPTVILVEFSTAFSKDTWVAWSLSAWSSCSSRNWWCFCSSCSKILSSTAHIIFVKSNHRLSNIAIKKRGDESITIRLISWGTQCSTPYNLNIIWILRLFHKIYFGTIERVLKTKETHNFIQNVIAIIKFIIVYQKDSS